MSGYASTGRLWKDNTPHAVNRTTSAITTKRLLSAKSTRARIMVFSGQEKGAGFGNFLLTDRYYVFKDCGIGYHLLGRLNARLDLLEVARQGIAADYLDTPELFVRRRHVDPVAVVQMEDGRCRHHRVHFLRQAAEGGGDEHAQAHHARIGDLDSNFGGADVRIEYGTDVADRSPEHAVGVGVQADLGGVAEMHIGQIVLINVADDPDAGEVGDSERVGGQALHAGRVSHLLVRDHSRHRRKDIHHVVWVIGVVTQQAEMFRHGFHVHLGLIFDVLGDLKVVQGDGAVEVQVLGALQLGARQDLVRHGFPVIPESAGYVVAVDGQQQLALCDGVAEARVNRRNAPGGERDHRDAAGDVGVHRAGDHQLRRRGLGRRRGDRELLRMFDGENTDVESGDDLSRGRSLRPGIRPRTSAAVEKQQRWDENDQKTNLDRKST